MDASMPDTGPQVDTDADGIDLDRPVGYAVTMRYLPPFARRRHLAAQRESEQ